MTPSPPDWIVHSGNDIHENPSLQPCRIVLHSRCHAGIMIYTDHATLSPSLTRPTISSLNLSGHHPLIRFWLAGVTFPKLGPACQAVSIFASTRFIS